MDNREENYSEPLVDNQPPVITEGALPTADEPWPEDAASAQEVDETEDPAEPEASDRESTDHPAKRLAVFLTHRQLPGADQNVASMLYRELNNTKLDEHTDLDVYLDTEQLPATRYREAIQRGIENADFVIALITANANQLNSDWIAFELGLAHQRWKRLGKPLIIPVHLEPIETYGAHIGPYVGGFQRIDYTGDNAELIADIRDAIRGYRSEPPDPGELERFVLTERRRDLMRASVLDLPPLNAAASQLMRDKLFWIVGDASVRNYAALSLAIKQQLVKAEGVADPLRAWKIYEITRPLRWSRVYNTLISDSIIVFNDVNPAALFDDETLRDELRSLDLLNHRNNFIIVTASSDSFLEIQQEMRKQEFRRGAIMNVDHNLYDEGDKLTIFNKLLDFSKEKGDVNPKQLEWARRNEVSEGLSSIIRKWSPADIERFVTWHLPQVKRPSDILKLLQRNADLDNEIHSWFISLDDSTRCFVMVLALFAELNKTQFWKRYKSVIKRLHKLDATLSLWPLGICRDRAALYVTTEGPLNFREERIADAIYREIAKNYREYFLELLPLMEEWSVPSGRNGNRADAFSEARRREAIKSRSLRDDIARMVGRMGQYGFNDLRGIVDRWATDPILQVRDAVALSLEQATAANLGTRHVFGILDDWCRESSDDEATLFKIWAAASALGTIAAANPGRQIYGEALDRLETMARDTRRSIRFYVSIPLKRALRRVRLTDQLENLVGLVIQDGQDSTRINIAEALNEARVFDEQVTLEVLGRWSASEDRNQRWTAMCSVILWSLWHGEECNQELTSLLLQEAETWVSIFVEIVEHKYHKRKAQSVFKYLVLNMPDETRKELVYGMAKISYAMIYERLLKRLKASGKPLFDTIIVDVRRERWRELLATPEEFAEDLDEELNSAAVSAEVYRALIELLRPEPEGCRQQAAAALADSFPQNHATLDKLLRKLNGLAPSALEPFSAEVRREAFRRLFYVPDVFVDTVAEYFADDNTVAEAHGAIEMLAQPEPEGYREDLLEALASGYALNQDATRRLLGVFRASPGFTLRLLAHEFTSRLIEGTLSNPAALYLSLAQATTDPYELTDVVQALKSLAVSGPWGQRKALVRALAQTRVSRTEDVDSLLQHPALQAEPELAGLRSEVRVATVLNRVFMPRFLTRFFTPR
jgi:hypothetical protein